MFKTSLFLVAGLALVLASKPEAKGQVQPQNKVYMNGPSMAIVPLSCLLACAFCPKGYVCPGKNPTPSGPPADIAQQRTDALNNGNAYRAAHSAPAQTVDPTLQAEAQAYAEQLAATGTFQHSTPNGAYGENLARLPSPATIAQANTAWYGEKPMYCPAGGSVNLAAGHFTQMIWKSSTTVGYGSAVGKDGYTYIVARYRPAGNVMGLESSNLQC